MTPVHFALPALLLLLASSLQAETLHDPTQPPKERSAAQTAAPPAEKTVSVIRLHGDSALAVINGETVRVGDTLNGARVLAIQADGVTLEQENRTWTLPLGTRPAMDIRRHP